MSKDLGSVGNLILFPSPISDRDARSQLSPRSLELANSCLLVFAEKPKVARSTLSRLGLHKLFEKGRIIEVGKRKEDEEITEGLMEILNGKSAILISDSGMPCIGDPGSEVVKRCHEMGIKVVPNPGPNSFMQALMASGFSGQNFAFHGYLPIEKGLRTKKIRSMVQEINRFGSPQIFMETPYRNKDLLKSLIHGVDPLKKLSISLDINGEEEEIITASIEEWKKMGYELPKLPAVFILGV